MNRNAKIIFIYEELNECLRESRLDALKVILNNEIRVAEKADGTCVKFCKLCDDVIDDIYEIIKKYHDSL